MSTISNYTEHFSGFHYHNEKNTEEEKRVTAVKCALELIAASASSETALFKDMDRLSTYADQIQSALEVKK